MLGEPSSLFQKSLTYYNLIYFIQCIRAQIQSQALKTAIIIGQFHCSTHKHLPVSTMKRFMKHEKINFFESPLPSQIQPQLFLHSPRRNWEAWHDCHEDQLFNTPLKQIHSTQQWIIEQDDISRVDHIEEQSESRRDEIMQQIQSMLPEINRKISFSDQQQSQAGFLQFTPVKTKVVKCDEQLLSTVQRRFDNNNNSQNESKFYSPESKLCERGLKKLAFEAYLFVSSQKRTTYKQVARKLISQLSDQGQLQSQKRGQLNIKRRVYDALNVLLALGLLKRNGNKIVGRKGDETLTIRRNCLQNEKMNLDTKDDVIHEERNSLIKEIKQKQTSIAEKRKILQSLNQKIAGLKQLQNRNKTQPINKNTIKLPFFMLCPKNNSLKQDQCDLQIWESPNQLNLVFPASSIELIGDLDILNQTKLDRSRRSNRR